MSKVRRLSVVVPVVLVALVLIACGQQPSEQNTGDLMTLLARVKTELTSGEPPRRQAPFSLREFRPFLEKQWIGNAVSYGPYRQGQAPGQSGPSSAEISEDLEIVLQHWNLIRIYGADDDSERILKVIDSLNLPLKVLLGIWLEPEQDSPKNQQDNVDQVLRGIELANRYPNAVIAVNVGNETQVFWSAHRMQTSTLVRYIRTVRNNVAVPVTTADDYNFWNKPESRSVADEIDFIVTHIYPLWNGKTLDNATIWMDSVYQVIRGVHPERTVVVGETGWATDYNAAKTGPGQQGTLVKGEVGFDGQTEYLIQLNNWVDSNQVTCFLFEAFDEPWKGGGADTPPNEIEKHWGVYFVDRTPKPSFTDYLSRAAATSK